MIRTTKALGLAVLALVIAATPTPSRALPPGQDGVSEHFPNDGAGGGNVDNPCTGCGLTMDLRLGVTGSAPITASVALLAGQSGAVVADNAATALCNAFVAAGWTCGGGCAFPSPLISCTNGARQVDFSQTSFSFTAVSGNAATKVTALHTKTSAGNTHGPDILNNVLIRVNPNTHDGNVLFGMTGATGAGPNPFTVNTTGLSDQALHAAIRSGYAALGVTAYLESSTDNAMSIVPANFDGFFVDICDPPNTAEFEVNGQPGQILIEETITVVRTPALSAWGMAILVGILLLTGIWMMRRRQTLQSA